MTTENRKSIVQTVMIGCGRMAQGHIRTMLAQQATTNIRVVCEPSTAAYTAVCDLFKAHNLTPPPNEPDLARLLEQYGAELDAAFIITPHAYHYAQTRACLEAGLDVLLEKPMVINATEAEGLIEARDRTGRLLVVAFPGSLSPRIRTAVEILRRGTLGKILNISGIACENWRTPNIGTWRQVLLSYCPTVPLAYTDYDEDSYLMVEFVYVLSLSFPFTITKEYRV